MHPAMLTLLVILSVAGIVVLALVQSVAALAIQMRLSGVRVSIGRLLRWRFRRADVRTIAFSAIRARKAGLGVPLDAIEAHYFAGGRVPNCVSALIAARKAGVDLTWGEVAGWDLAGTDPLEAVNAATSEPQA